MRESLPARPRAYKQAGLARPPNLKRMSIVASGVMFLAGACYGLMGVSMLLPLRQLSHVAALYPSLFKRFVQRDGVVGNAAEEAVTEAGRDELAYRLLGYVLVLLGMCRLITALYWGCGYVYLGLGSCVAEVALVSHELLRHDAVHLHRAMAVLSEIVMLSLIFLSAAVPHCH